MARGYLIFGDIDGKFDVLRVECTRCQRKGRYHVGQCCYEPDRILCSRPSRLRLGFFVSRSTMTRSCVPLPISSCEWEGTPPEREKRIGNCPRGLRASLGGNDERHRRPH
jgi:hypothetical protein